MLPWMSKDIIRYHSATRYIQLKAKQAHVWLAYTKQMQLLVNKNGKTLGGNIPNEAQEVKIMTTVRSVTIATTYSVNYCM